MLKQGDKAPDFNLESDSGSIVSLGDFKGKKLILYFYPKDNTPGCTLEARGFSMMMEKLAMKGVSVVGISPDNRESHCKFIEDHELQITLLTDMGNKTASAYFAYGEKMNYGKTYMGIIRSTFIIEDGIIKDAMYNVKATGHAERVLEKLENE